MSFSKKEEEQEQFRIFFDMLHDLDDYMINNLEPSKEEVRKRLNAMIEVLKEIEEEET